VESICDGFAWTKCCRCECGDHCVERNVEFDGGDLDYSCYANKDLTRDLPES
jgi:hypothetical protein